MSITTGSIYTSPSSQDPSGQPGFTGAGNFWMQTDTGIWQVRNSANTGWTLIGSGDQQTFGMVPLSGAALSGAITGATNLMTADGNTPFATPPTVTSRSSLMATMADLTTLQTNLNTLVINTANQAVASIVVPGIRANTSTQMGVIAAGVSWNTNLSLPYASMTYPDGTAVGAADCIGFATPNNIPNTGSGYTITLVQAGGSVNGMIWNCYLSPSLTPISINYMIFAIKQNT